MASVTNGFMKFFRSSHADVNASLDAQAAAQRLTRRSSAMMEVSRSLQSDESLCVLDIGYTSANNIRYLTERGHKVYSEDLLEAATDPELTTTDEQGNPILDSKRFLNENLAYSNAQFDVVLCWNLADYLDESLVKPVVGRLWSMIKPGGVLLAFFHTREAGPDAPCYRYHMLNTDTLEMQPVGPRRHVRKGPAGAKHTAIGSGFRLQRVFNNRHVETLFRDFASIKFFLTRDNIREVLVIR
jgi:SAM-dependent methyltransferase